MPNSMPCRESISRWMLKDTVSFAVEGGIGIQSKGISSESVASKVRDIEGTLSRDGMTPPRWIWTAPRKACGRGTGGKTGGRYWKPILSEESADQFAAYLVLTSSAGQFVLEVAPATRPSS
jgi:hypothetical protein